MSSDRKSLDSVLERALDGFGRIATVLGAALLVITAGALISALIVLPLWLAATWAPRLYSGVLAFLVLFLLAAMLVRKLRSGGAVSVVARLVQAGKWMVWLAAAYVSAVTLVNGLLTIGIPLLALVIVSAGYLGGRPRRQRG